MTRNPISLAFALAAAAALAACGAQSPQAGDATSASAPAGHATPAMAGDRMDASKSDVVAAFQRLGDARSYRMVTEGNEASGQERLEIDFVAPDRLRGATADGVQTIIGGDMYLQIEGRTMKHPARAGAFDGLLGQWKNAARMLELSSTTVEAIGSDRIDGKDTRRYRISNAEAGGGLGTVWIGDGYPLRLETRDETAGDGTGGVVTMHFSQINDPDLRIDPPGAKP